MITFFDESDDDWLLGASDEAESCFGMSLQEHLSRLWTTLALLPHLMVCRRLLVFPLLHLMLMHLLTLLLPLLLQPPTHWTVAARFPDEGRLPHFLTSGCRH